MHITSALMELQGNTKNENLRAGWRRWRNLLDLITAHRHYSHRAWKGHAKEHVLLLNLARFASQEMGHFNTAYHARQICRLP